MTNQKWPEQIWLVRHGQSAGNVAREVAEAGGFAIIDIAERDIDVPLSELGEQQAAALGHWFNNLAPEHKPTVVLSSPYLRARHTAQLILEGIGDRHPPHTFINDERLREKEFGILDRLTQFGIAKHHPQLYEQREHVGKFYFRPPGGESWCDVILRLRNVIDTITRDYPGERVLIVAHQVIVQCFRYLLEHMDEKKILGIDKASDVPNCSVTSYRFNPNIGKFGQLELRAANFVAPLLEAGAAITDAPDKTGAPKP
ncbi:MAG: histidine phosphatase family protein [Oxalicibacterium faecigallinarum]|uniref:Phosphoglycerate mutase n=1 Tax=Oxalicibacterium faecigallinarum TaxID=573741 RepID=A0A8J3AUV0_9BURK|nr:histidine phosphatase family protein [Oxalicibacterium faecigallinarum]MDQ7968880.1 histidine phosphatase family protein [Oxalicibacterium faecigallinarum]GGI21566.1 phosphoglycerate mutase [Oxalicibacterium faecigallinarum]